MTMQPGQLPSGFRARPAVLDDAGAVATVNAASEAARGQGYGMTTEIVRHFWRTLDLATQTLVIETPTGEIVAAADIENQGYVSVSIHGHVHPDFYGLGLGSFIITWGERWAHDHLTHAPPNARVVTRHLIPSSDERATALFDARGYQRTRVSFHMAIDLEESPPEPDWPAGISQTPYRPDLDEREIHEAVEDTFRDVWGRPASSFERFLRNRPDRREQADLWIVARAGRDIAGISLGKAVDSVGWIDNVGVREAWRRQGVGLALLHASFGAFYRRGIERVRLIVDAESSTAAPRLYERAGMSITGSFIDYQKVLREGVDLSDRRG
jgi:ribosomal protein S18 acetylase RimI-like enzyme